MNITNELNEKFYNFINMYNAVIKHCSNKNRRYDIKLFFINDSLHFQVIDQESEKVLHNSDLQCSKEESELICNTVTSEFVLNHPLKYAAYIPMNGDDILSYRKLSDEALEILPGQYGYVNNGQLMVTHTLENTKFSLKIYLYDGIDKQTDLLHEKAIKKISDMNAKVLRK